MASSGEKTLMIHDHSHDENVPIKKKRGTSEVWTFFKHSNNKKCAKCNLCGKEYKTSGNTSNLLDHLKRAHPTFEKSSSVVKIDSFFNKDGYDHNSARKLQLDNALVWMVATDIQPFHIVEDSGFRNFVKCLDHRYVLPSRGTLQNVHMKDTYDKVKQKLQIILNEVDYCAITTDCWTSRATENYLTVTCHFVTKLTLKSAVLSTKKLLTDTNHSAVNISESLHNVLSDCSVLHKVTAIVTDNAASMLKACELLQKRHLPCFAHSINLVVQDALSQTNVKNVLGKCKRIVGFFKSSTIVNEKFKRAQQTEKPYSLLQEVPTRWNSAYLMITRILLTKDAISSVLLSTSKAPSPLTADEVQILEDLSELFAPFHNATVQASANNSVTISLIIPISYGIYQSLHDLKNKMKTIEGLDTYNYLIERLQIRIFSYENRTVTRMGTILDARFKKEGFRSPLNADLASKLLEDEIADDCKTSLTSPAVVKPTTSLDKPSQPETQLFQFLHKKIEEKIKSNRADAIIITRQYLERPNAPQHCDPMEYWRTNENDWKNVLSSVKKYSVYQRRRRNRRECSAKLD